MPLVDDATGRRVDDDVGHLEEDDVDVEMADNDAAVDVQEPNHHAVDVIIGAVECTFSHPTDSQHSLFTYELHTLGRRKFLENANHLPKLSKLLGERATYRVIDSLAPPLGFSPLLLYRVVVYDSHPNADKYANSIGPNYGHKLSGWPRIVSIVSWHRTLVVPEKNPRYSLDFYEVRSLYKNLTSLLEPNDPLKVNLHGIRAEAELPALNELWTLQHSEMWFHNNACHTVRKYNEKSCSGREALKYGKDTRYKKSITEEQGNDNYFVFPSPVQIDKWIFAHPTSKLFPLTEYVQDERVQRWLNKKPELTEQTKCYIRGAVQIWHLFFHAPIGTTMITPRLATFPFDLCADYENNFTGAVQYLQSRKLVNTFDNGTDDAEPCLTLCTADKEQSVLLDALFAKNVLCVHWPAFAPKGQCPSDPGVVGTKPLIIYRAHDLTIQQLAEKMKRAPERDIVMCGDATLAAMPRIHDIIAERGRGSMERPFAQLCAWACKNERLQVQDVWTTVICKSVPTQWAVNDKMPDVWMWPTFHEALSAAQKDTSTSTKLLANEWYLCPRHQVTSSKRMVLVSKASNWWICLGFC